MSPTLSAAFVDRAAEKAVLFDKVLDEVSDKVVPAGFPTFLPFSEVLKTIQVILGVKPLRQIHFGVGL